MTDLPNPYAAPQGDLWPAGKSTRGDVAFDDAPIATFRCVLDAEWYKRGSSRWAKAFTSPLTACLSLLALAAAVALLVFFSIPPRETPVVVRLLASIPVGAMVFFLFFLAWLFNRWYIPWILLRRFRTTNQFNAPCHFTLYREGLASSGPATIYARKWSGFVSCRLFSDGILLRFDGMQFCWLPWTDLISGKPDDVQAILQASLSDYKDMRA